MDASTIVGIAIAVVAAVWLAALLVQLRRKRHDNRRAEAGQQRERAQREQIEARERQNEAELQRARANRERIAAERKTLEAEQAHRVAAGRFRRADEIDPDRDASRPEQEVERDEHGDTTRDSQPRSQRAV